MLAVLLFGDVHDVVALQIVGGTSCQAPHRHGVLLEDGSDWLDNGLLAKRYGRGETVCLFYKFFRTYHV